MQFEKLSQHRLTENNNEFYLFEKIFYGPDRTEPIEGNLQRWYDAVEQQARDEGAPERKRRRGEQHGGGRPGPPGP